MQLYQAPQDIQSWTIERILTECKPHGWEQIIDEAKDEIKDVSGVLAKFERVRGPYLPLKKDLFNALWLTPLDQVKVVILGQDPYHQPGVAQGLAFSVRKGEKIPVSLRNIFKELTTDIPGFTMPEHGDLTSWCTQGVLLLNTCLTVDPGQAGSHGAIWEDFVVKVILAVCHVNPKAVYLLWGRKAQSFRSIIVGTSVVLEASHPSGFSVKGFLGCKHFSQTNQALLAQGKEPINWNL